MSIVRVEGGISSTCLLAVAVDAWSSWFQCRFAQDRKCQQSYRALSLVILQTCSCPASGWDEECSLRFELLCSSELWSTRTCLRNRIFWSLCLDKTQNERRFSGIQRSWGLDAGDQYWESLSAIVLSWVSRDCRILDCRSCPVVSSVCLRCGSGISSTSRQDGWAKSSLVADQLA